MGRLKIFAITLKPLTLTVGENNTGKSDLLNSIKLILGQEVSYFKKSVLDDSDFNYDIWLILKDNS